jgi:hypothetical protein
MIGLKASQPAVALARVEELLARKG